MKLISCNNVETNRYQLEVAVDAKEFNEGIEKAYQKAKNKIALPGFRKGKTPRAFIEKYYGKDVFFEDAIEEIYPEALDAAIAEAKLDVIEDKIDFEVVEVSKENGLTFKATVTTMPVVDIKDYKGLKIAPKSIEVTEEDVDAKVKELLDRYSRMVTVDRGAENDDIVVMDFEGFLDGQPFEGGQAENYSLTLGTKMFIPGFEEQLIGHKAGDDVEVNVTFPEDYQAKELAGKAAVFKVKVHEIKKKELPEINDEFAQDVSEFDTLDEYKEDVKKGIAEQKEKAARQEKQEKIIRQIVENAEMDIPDPMVVTQTRQMMDQFAQRMQSNGLSMAQYYQFTGLTPDGLLEQMKPQAQKNIENRLVLEAIAAAEGITASEEEVEKEFANIAERYGLTVDKVKEIFADEETENIKSDIAAQKALDMITEAAVEVPVTEVEATVEDAE